MNTIKIYLAESGRVADLHKDFPLYQYQYQNKLLNVFVPTSILAPQFTTLSEEGQTLNEYVAGTAVKIGMTYLTRSGEIKVSQSSYMRYLKTLTYQNVEYALFERKLPKEFTLYAGQGQNAPVLVINVVNIETDTDPVETLSIIPSQTCSLDVMPSSNLDNDAAIEPSELDTINSRLNAIDETLTEKQDKTDESIQVTTDSEDQTTWQDSQTVVGAINNNTAQNELNKTNIATNTSDISQNTSDIAYLYAHMAQPEEYIGQMTGSVLPSNAELTAFVEETADREPKNADVVIFILQISGETDKNYKYIYAVNGWNGYEIPALEEADNGSLGLIEGTYNVGSTNNTLVDISGGKILNIYVKDETNTYRNIREYLNTNASSIASIISGSTNVGVALRAIADKLGNDITTTYLTVNAGVTKQQMLDYALPREFNDVNFFTATGYSGELPSGSSPIHTIDTSAVGDFEIFNAEKELSNVSFQLSNKNSYTDTLYVSASINCTVQFRLTTELYVNADWVTANVELTDEIEMVASQVKKLTFASSMNALTNVYSLGDGNKIRQTLEVVTATSSAITFNVYSNDVYPSTFYLNTTSKTIVISQGRLGELPVFEILGSGDTTKVTFEIPTSDYIENNVEALFVLSYSGSLLDTTQLELEYNSQSVQIITPANDGTNTNATVRTMFSKFSENGDRWIFTGVFKISNGNISVIADVDELNDFTYVDETIAPDGVNPIASLISNPNLLINGDFKVNQRGKASYTGSGSRLYTVDRWAITSSASVSSINTSSISVNFSTQYQAIEQKIEDYEKLKGKMVTLSCKISNVTISSGDQLFLRYNSGDVNGTTKINSDGIYSLTFTVSNSATQLAVQIFSGTGTGIAYSFDLEWIKLEIGSLATPYSPRPYAEELSMCQRYYFKLVQSNSLFNGFVFSNTVSRISIFLPQELRTSPTITLETGVSTCRGYSNGSIYTPTSVTFSAFGNNNVVINCSISAETNQTIAFRFLQNVEFDAEIY